MHTASAPAQTATLVYDAATEILSGSIGSAHFHMRAYSGGSRGHSQVSAELAAKYLHQSASRLASRWANTPTIEDKSGNYKQRGGTLPAGHYRCEYIPHHPSFLECIRLHRKADASAIQSPFSPFPIPHGRTDSFFIHGSGAKGSDGCIVPANAAARHRLNQAVKDFNGSVTLIVKNVSYLLPAELEGQFA